MSEVVTSNATFSSFNRLAPPVVTYLFSCEKKAITVFLFKMIMTTRRCCLDQMLY